ncbi:protein-lysine N-methyltransferase SMYD4-like [Glandiceps talaboti]
METGSKDNSSDEYNSLFKKVCDKLQETGDVKALSVEFGKLKNEADRVAFALKLQSVHDIVNVVPTFQQKSADKSRELRSKGNTAFQKQQNEKALEFYTESILFAPISDEEDGGTLLELALALANRSAVLYHMKEHKLCLEDIERAIQNGYPEELRYKLHYRRGGCLRALKRNADARERFQEARESADISKLDKKKLKSFKSDIDAQLKLCRGDNVNGPDGTKEKTANKVPPELSYGQNKQIPCASSALEIKSSPEAGRYAVATRDIKAGDVLIVEKPYASVVLLPCNATHCQHCYKNVLAPIPCKQCASVAYCSVKCREESWNEYHSLECKHLDFIQNIGLGMGHLAFRIVVKTGLPFLLKFREQQLQHGITNPETGVANPEDGFLGCNDKGVYINEYYSIHHLVTNSHQRTVGDLFKRTVKAICLLKCLQGTDFFKSAQAREYDFDIHAYIGGIILTHLQNIPCNAHEISEYELYKSSVEKCEFVEVGSGLYATMSLLNHSCDPAVTRNCYSDVCVVRATRNVNKGEEIVDNYGYLYPVHKKAERRTKLKQQYYFECKCDPCVHNWPLYMQIEDKYPTYKCKACHLPLKIPLNPNMEAMKCSHCHHKQNLMQQIATMRVSEERYRTALTNVLEGKLEGMIPALRNHLSLMDGMYSRPWRDINNCQEALKQCYNVDANCIICD